MEPTSTLFTCDHDAFVCFWHRTRTVKFDFSVRVSALIADFVSTSLEIELASSSGSPEDAVSSLIDRTKAFQCCHPTGSGKHMLQQTHHSCCLLSVAEWLAHIHFDVRVHFLSVLLLNNQRAVHKKERMTQGRTEISFKFATI